MPVPAQMRLMVIFAAAVWSFVGTGCDLVGDDEGIESESVMLTFRVEAATPPNDGWVYWYVHEGLLYRVGAGLSHGPFGATVDCGTHAGMAAHVVEGPDASAEGALVIETLEHGRAEPTIAREEYSGPGEHQMIVLVSCP